VGEVKTAKNFDFNLKLSKMWTGRFNGKASCTRMKDTELYWENMKWRGRRESEVYV